MTEKEKQALIKSLSRLWQRHMITAAGLDVAIGKGWIDAEQKAEIMAA